MKALVLATALLCVSGFASAGFYTGNDLKKWIDADGRMERSAGTADDSQEQMLFDGYVLGVFDAAGIALSCPPSNLRGRQVLAIVKKYVDASPEKWGESAAGLVISSLKGAFPCGEPQQEKPSEVPKPLRPKSIPSITKM